MTENESVTKQQDLVKLSLEYLLNKVVLKDCCMTSTVERMILDSIRHHLICLQKNQRRNSEIDIFLFQTLIGHLMLTLKRRPSRLHFGLNCNSIPSL